MFDIGVCMTVTWFDSEIEKLMQVELIDVCSKDCKISGAMVCKATCPLSSADMLELIEQIDSQSNTADSFITCQKRQLF